MSSAEQCRKIGMVINALLRKGIWQKLSKVQRLKRIRQEMDSLHESYCLNEFLEQIFR